MNVKSCFVGNEISFSYLGKDLIGFLDKRYISEGFVEYFTEITLYLLYSFLKKKKEKKKNGCEYKVSFYEEWNWKRSFE